MNKMTKRKTTWEIVVEHSSRIEDSGTRIRVKMTALVVSAAQNAAVADAADAAAVGSVVAAVNFVAIVAVAAAAESGPVRVLRMDGLDSTGMTQKAGQEYFPFRRRRLVATVERQE